MTTNLKPLFPPIAQDHAVIAVVAEVEAGQACRLTLADDSPAVVGHLSGVETLHPGDKVLAVPTASGYVVTGRLRAPAENPPPRLEAQEGHLRLEAPRSIRLQAGQSWIEIHADGRIQIDGEQITGLAAGRMRLQGATIELN